MRSGFTKKTSAASKKEAAPIYTKQQGIMQGPTGHYLISTGCFSLDSVIGGGLPVASLVLVTEDSLSEDYVALLRLAMGEGVENSQQCIVVDSQDWTGLIPYTQKVTAEAAAEGPKPSTQKEEGK